MQVLGIAVKGLSSPKNGAVAGGMNQQKTAQEKAGGGQVMIYFFANR